MGEFSDWDKLWNQRAALVKQNLPHEVCPVHLVHRLTCCYTGGMGKSNFGEPEEWGDCAKCSKHLPATAFRSASGKLYPWCIECRRKYKGKKGFIPEKDFSKYYLET